MHVTVVPAGRSKFTSKGLTYATDDKRVMLGSHVLIPLKKRTVEGIVIGDEADAGTFKIRDVQEVIGALPLLPEHLVRFLQWISKEYWCAPREVLSAMLPPPPWTALPPKPEYFYQLGRQAAMARGKRQLEIVDLLEVRGEMGEIELLRALDISRQSLLRMERRDMLLRTERTMNTPERGESAEMIRKGRPKLTAEQQRALDEILSTRKPSVLFGVTASGKTEIYAELIARAIQAGKQAMLLVPEILLTEGALERFGRLIPPDRIEVLHSRRSVKQRRESWRRIRSGTIDLVIGSRSALFAPLGRLGLIILDEEHEWTYKNEHAPRYHTREAAEELARLTGARLVLVSATPSLESWARAQSAQYTLVRLPERYRNHTQAVIRVIDLADVPFGRHYPFSAPLIAGIGERLKRGQQSVLFLNRRGMATALLCFECRRRIVSPETNLPFTVHRSAEGALYLADHTSGLTMPLPARCPGCGSVNLKPVGAGTQRIELTVRELFPSARVLRADSDTLNSPEKIRSLLSQMQRGAADILLGTQSVAKGLDLPGVTLAAVLLADTGLTLPHFRAGERVHQLIAQLIGRSGRHQPGEVIVQTFRPSAPEIALAVAHRTEEYLYEELRLRIASRYPPAVRMVRLLVRGSNPGKQATDIATQALRLAKNLGPDLRIGAAPTFHGGGKIWHVLIRGTNPLTILSHLDLQGITVDVDPMETI